KTVRPSWEKPTHSHSRSLLASSTRAIPPGPSLQRLTAVPPETSVLPSGENATELISPCSGGSSPPPTRSRWGSAPTSVRRRVPLAVSHKRTVLSGEPVARVLPSGENATEETASSCPARVRCAAPSAALQVRALRSSEAVATVCPSGEKATLLTSPAC